MKKILKEIVAFLAIVLVVIIIKEFTVEIQLIPTGSMIPNINVGDRIIVSRFNYGLQNPLYNAKMKKSIMLIAQNPLYKNHLPFSNNKYILPFKTPLRRFDVIVFFPPETPVLGKEYYYNNDKTQIPVYFEPPQLIGERYVKRLIGLPGEKLEIRNGDVYINDQFLHEPQVKNNDYSDFGPIKIPEKHYFFMGDNRPRSSDSRVWGLVPEEKILGKAWAVIWPLKAIKLVH